MTLAELLERMSEAEFRLWQAYSLPDKPRESTEAERNDFLRQFS